MFLAGRDKPLRRFERTLQAAPELPANIKLTGLRGVGKTVLLKEFDQRAVDLGWLTSRVQVEPRHNQSDSLTSLVISQAERAILQASRSARVRAAVAGVVTKARGLVTASYEDIKFALDGSAEHTASMAEALYDAATAADASGREGYILMLDEAQVLRDDRNPAGDHPLSLLIATVNSLQDAGLPIGLVLCGLPTLKANLLKARTYTERMFRGEEISRLTGPPDGSDAIEAFVKPLEGTGVSADPSLIERVVEEVEGYPYFIQIWGAELWDAATDADLDVFDDALLDQVEPDIYDRLDSDFYSTRVDSLTPAEQDLLMATAKCDYPPLRTATIRNHSPKTDSNVNVLMGRLSDQGVVYRIQKGVYEYTAPKFHDYLRRRATKLAGQQ